MDELATIFYSTLFDRFPHIRPLFADTDLDDQKVKLIGALKFVVENVAKPDAYTQVLKDLGRRQLDYGTKITH